MSMIELGDASGAGPVPAPPPDHRRIRHVALLIAAVLGMVLLGGSAPPRSEALPLRWSLPIAEGAAVSYDEDTVYVSRPSDQQTEITAYDLDSGRVRWVHTAGFRTEYAPDPAGPVLLLATAPVEIVRKTGDLTEVLLVSRSTIALDRETGAEAWRASGQPGGWGRRDTMVIEEFDVRGYPVRLKAVRPADGSLVWSRPVARESLWAVVWAGDRTEQIASATRDGAVTVWDAASGRTSHTGKVRGPVTGFSSVAGKLLVARVAAGDAAFGEAVDVHRPTDLARLWTLAKGEGGATSCGPVICTSFADGVVGRDPATGRELWRHTGLEAGLPLTGDRLALSTLDEETRSANLLIDATTGRAIGPRRQGSWLWRTDPDGRVLALRASREPEDVIAVSRIDLLTGAETLIGTLPEIAGTNCTDLGRHLFCETASELSVRAVG